MIRTSELLTWQRPAIRFHTGPSYCGRWFRRRQPVSHHLLAPLDLRCQCAPIWRGLGYSWPRLYVKTRGARLSEGPALLLDEIDQSDAANADGIADVGNLGSCNTLARLLGNDDPSTGTR
jgi:hypothetical protein